MKYLILALLIEASQISQAEAACTAEAQKIRTEVLNQYSLGTVSTIVVEYAELNLLGAKLECQELDMGHYCPEAYDHVEKLSNAAAKGAYNLVDEELAKIQEAKRNIKKICGF